MGRECGFGQAGDSMTSAPSPDSGAAALRIKAASDKLSEPTWLMELSRRERGERGERKGLMTNLQLESGELASRQWTLIRLRFRHEVVFCSLVGSTGLRHL